MRRVGKFPKSLVDPRSRDHRVGSLGRFLRDAGQPASPPTMTFSRLTVVAVATLAAACALSASAKAATKGCGQAGYTYAGVQSTGPARGISASLTALRTASVTSGHVAAWVGVGGPGQGANGA